MTHPLSNTQFEESVVHHGGNLAAMTFPWVALLTNMPAVLSSVTTVLGICWYAALFYDRYKRNKKEGK